jgi:lysophospholipase L1-like esterase
MGQDIKILVFGDSDAYGAWDYEGGWVERLKKYLTKKVIDTSQNFYCTLYNLSISGNTTDSLLKRFESETKQRIHKDEKIIIIFAIGANDTIKDRKGNLWTTPAKFAKNVDKLTALARKYSKNILYVLPAPVDESRTNPVFWDVDVSFKNARLKEYNEVIKAACEKNNAQFIDIFVKWIKSDYKNLLEDGVHPNSEGHKMIFEEVMKLLCTLSEFQAFQS